MFRMQAHKEVTEGREISLCYPEEDALMQEIALLFEKCAAHFDLLRGNLLVESKSTPAGERCCHAPKDVVVAGHTAGL